MKKALARFWYFITGWKVIIDPEVLEPARHSVMVAAPHTSNWDFPFAIFGFWLMEIDVRYFIKNSYTKGPMGWFFTWTGAIGVDRSQTNNLVEHTANLLKENEKLVILVPAEGTRKRVDKWKSGFYNIASEAGVPISLGYCDFPKKIAGVGQVVKPSGDFEADMEIIERFYANKVGKHPENYNPKIY